VKVFMYGDNWVEHLRAIYNERPDLGIDIRCMEYPDVSIYKLIKNFIWADVVVRVGVRPGAPGKRLLILDLVWVVMDFILRGNKVVYYWIGTDVLDALISFKPRRFFGFLNFAKNKKHLANAVWLVDELQQIGIKSRLSLFPVAMVNPPSINEIKWPEKFSVLTYIPDGRSEFYGGEAFLEAALSMPDVDFFVVGGHGGWLLDKPVNLYFLGYVSDMEKVINNVNVVVRLVKHDAIGGTVREGLFFARHVIYSYNLLNTIYVPWGDSLSLIKELKKLKKCFDSGLLEKNIKGHEYAVSEWSPDVLMKSFASEIANISHNK